MGSFSIWHWLIVLAVVLILFGGKGKISQIMGDIGKGLKSFKKSVKEEEPPEESPAFTETKTIRSGPDRIGEAAAERDRANKT
jgi:sec-independent protein translocase protein TatA